MDNKKDMKEKIDRLKNIAIFKDVSEDSAAMEIIANLFTTKFISSGQTVIEEGKFGNDLYIIGSGTVEIVKKTLQENDNYTVTELSSDQNIFFGEVALLDPDKRSATVICKTDCSFYVLTKDNFTKLGDENPKLGLSITRELSRIICNRMRKANADIITLFGALVEEVAESGGLDD